MMFNDTIDRKFYKMEYEKLFLPPRRKNDKILFYSVVEKHGFAIF